jgi:Tfp pilus assembly protein PilX
MVIVMIVIVAMSLAGVALFRSVDTNVLIAGNLAFKQTTILGSDAGIQNAITTLSGYDLEASGNGYSANEQTWDYTGSDPTVADFDWAGCVGNSTCVQTVDGVGNIILWTAHRMCSAAGSPLTTDCVRGSASGGGTGGTEGSSQGSASSGPPLSRDTQVYYRITTRITGPRNTVSYAQAMVK